MFQMYLSKEIKAVYNLEREDQTDEPDLIVLKVMEGRPLPPTPEIEEWFDCTARPPEGKYHGKSVQTQNYYQEVTVETHLQYQPRPLASPSAPIYEDNKQTAATSRLPQQYRFRYYQEPRQPRQFQFQ